MDKKDLKLTKKLLSSYRNRLEKEIIKTSHKIRIPQKAFQEIINKNIEINKLEIVLAEIDKRSSSKSNSEK